MNFEYPKDYVFSSAAYVAANLKVKETREDHRLQKLPLRKPANCDHTATICKDCAYMWEQDYELLYNRTVGGRRLEEDVHHHNALRDAQ